MCKWNGQSWHDLTTNELDEWWQPQFIPTMEDHHHHTPLIFFNRSLVFMITPIQSHRNGFHIEGNKSRWFLFPHSGLLCVCCDVDIFSNIWRIFWLCKVRESLLLFVNLLNSGWNYHIDQLDCRKSADNAAETQETSANGATKKPVQFGSSSMNEYLLGSRKLKPFPVAMSLVAR